MPATFATRVLAWFDQHGRRDLPWQNPRDPYRVWVSEIMLQQTQVATVIPYFERFMAAFPDVADLAAATEDDVLGHWAGLGYYARARNLHSAAQIVRAEHDGLLPDSLPELMALPGIGRSTAAAILAQAHGQRHAILDGNVRRLLSRYFAVEGWSGVASVQSTLWEHSESLLPDADMADYTQALMDLGSQVCRRSRPDCENCPVASDCRARALGKTAELPTPRPRRKRPLRRVAVMLVIASDGSVLLERRPSEGIWGGLWSLPEIPADSEPWAFCGNLTGSPPEQLFEQESFRHAFTHFELEITPYIALEPVSSGVRDASGTTGYEFPRHKRAAPDDLPAVPAPIRRIIEAAAASQQTATNAVRISP